MGIKALIVDDLVARKIRVSESGCYEYQGAITSAGYGSIRRDHRSWQAHRYVWTLVNGQIPYGLHVCHKCDNKKCLNPEHLFLGTHLDNMRDKRAKGRENMSGLRPGEFRPLPIYGEKSHLAKISNAMVMEIRTSVLQHRTPQKAVAERVGISRAQVSRIVNNLSRTHQ